MMDGDLGVRVPPGQNPSVVQPPAYMPPVAQTAHKVNAKAVNCFTWLAVLCAGASMALFFSAVFVSSSFTGAYIVSMIATIVFGLAGDCRARRAASPQGFHPPGVDPFPPLTYPTYGRGGIPRAFQRIVAPPPPPFVDGQPLQLKNDGSSCFIDATFWAIMSLPSYKEALVASCQKWVAGFDAWNKFGIWISNALNKQPLTTNDLRLLIPFLSTLDMATHKKIFESKLVSSPSEALTCFEGLIKGYRNACIKNQPHPIILDEDLDKILPLFTFHCDWTPKQVNTLSQLMLFIETKGRKARCPSQQDLKSLESILVRKEYEAIFREQIEKPSPQLRSPVLKAFVSKVNSEIEENQLGRVAPGLFGDSPKEEQDSSEGCQFFDIFTVASFAQNNGSLQRKGKGVKGFLDAVKAYDEASSQKQVDPGIFLSELRHLLREDQSGGQQDASDMRRALFDLIDPREYPNLFFPLVEESQYTRLNISDIQDETTKQAMELQLSASADKNRQETKMTPNNIISKASRLEYEIPLWIPNGPAFGNKLLEGAFEFHRDFGHNHAIYLDPDTNERTFYSHESERFVRPEFSGQFVITLKRFGIDPTTGAGVKNNQPVIMPEFLELDGNHYEIVTIIQHQGSYNGGHYFTLQKREGKWWMCDDMNWYVREATEEEVKAALMFAYTYFVKEVKGTDMVPLLTEWPPKELPPPVKKLPPKPSQPKATVTTETPQVQAGTPQAEAGTPQAEAGTPQVEAETPN